MVVSLVIVDVRVVDHGAPVEHARHLQRCVAGAVSGDSHRGRDELVVVDTAIVRADDSAQLGQLASLVGARVSYAGLFFAEQIERKGQNWNQHRVVGAQLVAPSWNYVPESMDWPAMLCAHA